MMSMLQSSTRQVCYPIYTEKLDQIVNAKP